MIIPVGINIHLLHCSKKIGPLDDLIIVIIHIGVFPTCLLLCGNWTFPRTLMFTLACKLKILNSLSLLLHHKKINTGFHKVEICKLKYGYYSYRYLSF